MIYRRIKKKSKPIKVSKSAAELIEKFSLDQSTIKGTGKGGNITVGDVRKVIKANGINEESEETVTDVVDQDPQNGEIPPVDAED